MGVTPDDGRAGIGRPRPPGNGAGGGLLWSAERERGLSKDVMPPSVSVRLPAPAGTHNARPFFAYGLKRKEREEERDGSRREGAAFLLSLPSFARPSVRVHFGGYFWLPTAREQQNQLYGSARSLRVPQSNSGDRAAVSGCTARIHPPSNQLSLHPSILREREREREAVGIVPQTQREEGESTAEK